MWMNVVLTNIMKVMTVVDDADRAVNRWVLTEVVIVGGSILV